MKEKVKERAVVVTTEHRGVFFGYAENTDGDPIKLKRARLCVSWSSDLRGFLGLASHGPNGNCRISRPVPEIELRKITSVMEATPEAVAAWEAGRWS